MVFRKRKKRNKEPMEITLRNKIILMKVSGNVLRQQTELRRKYWQSESKSKESIKHHQRGSRQKVGRGPWNLKKTV